MGLYPHWVASKAGSRATEACEPRQVRKEATVSGVLRVPRECLAGAVQEDTLKGLCRRGVHGLKLYLLFHGCMKDPQHIAYPRSVRGPKPTVRLSAKKSLGQHFLVDGAVLEQILSASELDPLDTVVEVGPGRGALTRHLVQRAKTVIAIEVDSNLAARLTQDLSYAANLKVVNADARDVELEEVLEGEDSYKLVANLPYYAANPILRRFLEAARLKPSLLVVMVQREVAVSMVAEAGRMSLLSVGIQVYGVPRIVCYVPPQAFYPPPKVTSAVVRIDLRPHPAISLEEAGEFFDMVRAGFSAPRKQLRNSLALGLGISNEQTSHLIGLAGLDPRQRAERLTIPDWWQLYRAGRERLNCGHQSIRQDKSHSGSAGAPRRRLPRGEDGPPDDRPVRQTPLRAGASPGDPKL